jgi:hypothetical protein
MKCLLTEGLMVWTPARITAEKIGSGTASVAKMRSLTK